MANERITEDLVDDRLRELGYYEDAEKIIVEKQQSGIELVRKSLSKASKTGGGGGGFPEFIITAPDTPDMIVVIECKAETRWHESENRDRPKDFAVDGVLHYASFLTHKYTVISIAVSGTPAHSEWSFFVTTKTAI